jgi:hypothetical protein
MQKLSRVMWFGYLLLCLGCGLGFARFDDYLMDGDSLSFMDIADGIRGGHFAAAVNGYWNPGYPALLAVAQIVAHPSRWDELHTYAHLNLLIAAGAVLACIYFVGGLVLLQRRLNVDGVEEAMMSPLALKYAGVGVLMFSFRRELRLGFMLSDTLLMVMLVAAAGMLLRVLVKPRIWRYGALGVLLGLAYLVKSFAFLPSMFLCLGLLLYGLKHKGSERRRMVGGAVLTGVMFGVVAGPYIIALSRQLGHLTTGESARLNYAFFVDDMPRFHEWAHHDLGRAKGTFVHPEMTLLESPWVFSYRNHAVGTTPQWYDPAYFTLGVKPVLWLPGHVARMKRCTQLLALYVADHPEGVLLLLVLLASGGIVWRRKGREQLLWLAAPAWGLLMLAIYFPIDLQERYMITMLLLVLLPALAMLRKPDGDGLRRVANATAVLLALIAVGVGIRDILQMRRQLHGRSSGLYSQDQFGAARGLLALGTAPQEGVACMGNYACVRDSYWARLANVQVVGEIEVPDEVPTEVAWDSFQNKPEVLEALRSQGIKVIVTGIFSASHIPDGWQQLDGSNFFAYRIP